MTNDRSFLKRFAWLSIAAAVATIGLKTVAFFLTGSVGLLSDAMESVVNLIGGVMALAMLTIAARPEDRDHTYGHSKAEYFSSTVEGMLILIAAFGIAVTAIGRLLYPKPLEQIGLGLAVSVGASLINLAVSLVIRRAGRRYQSITLEANARHLMTDVWTSAGVLVGVGSVAWTGWLPLDPVVALIVAANIVYTSYGILRSSVLGLMDTALPADEQERLSNVLRSYELEGIQFHALRSRQAGARRFVSFHVIVPGDWTVHHGHRLLERIESDIRQTISNTTVFTHLEPADDPASWDDQSLDRKDRTAP